MNYYSIAIDGPAGAGKSTIAKEIAKKLNMIYIDTGAMYRAFALYCIWNNIKSDDEEKISQHIDKIHISIEYKNNEQQVLLNGKNVNSFIRTEEIGNMASSISVYPNVRLKLVELQRELAKKSNVIMDGRDIGTYVLPKATLKIYLTASVEIRAKRRYADLESKGISITIDEVKEEIIKRDKRDMEREFAPLTKADDAHEVDTSNLTIKEVVQVIIDKFNSITNN